MEKKYEVESKYSGYLSVKESENGVTRTFPRSGFKMFLTKDSIMKIMSRPGGRFIFENRLLIKDKELANELELNFEPEDLFNREEIKELLNKGTIEQLKDALNFGSQGTVELIKDVAIEEQISDTNKRKIISDYTGLDINKIIENSDGIDNASDVELVTKRRSSEPFVPQNQKKETEKYKMINNKRVRVE